MSLYNLAYGFNPACIFLMPMLGRKQEDYPRFRDCFLSDNFNSIIIYTRVGGGNRNQGFGEEELYNDENFIRTWDDGYDSTYGYYEFKVPDKWINDFNLIMSKDFGKLSDDYINLLKSFWPKLDLERFFNQFLNN